MNRVEGHKKCIYLFTYFFFSASLPLNWEDMKGQSVVLIELKAGSQKFTEVEKEFRETGLSNNIIKVSLLHLYLTQTYTTNLCKVVLKVSNFVP